MNRDLDQRGRSRPRLLMRWSSLAFFHWPIDPAQLRHLIPPAFELDTFDGRAWVGLVPFTMPLVRHRGWPRVPTMHAFHECNVRTYVTPRLATSPTHRATHQIGVARHSHILKNVRTSSGVSEPPAQEVLGDPIPPRTPAAEHRDEHTPGVWFFSLDAASRIAAWGARTFWNLPYHHAKISLARNDNCEVTYSVERCGRRSNRRRGHANDSTTCTPAMRARWQIGPPLPSPSREGELAHFLTERYCLYSLDRRGRAVRARIHHNPWPLREATVLELEDSLIPAAGIELDTNLARNPPIAWHADELDVQAWGLEKTQKR